MEFYNVINSRHSIRDFAEETIPEAVMKRIVKAAYTAHNEFDLNTCTRRLVQRLYDFPVAYRIDLCDDVRSLTFAGILCFPVYKMYEPVLKPERRK